MAIETADPTATIHWTEGSDAPTADSPVYTGPILVSSGQTLQAIAVDPAGNASPVGTFPFEIVPPAPVTIADPGAIVPSTFAPARVGPGRARVVPLRLTSLAGPGRISARRLRATGLRLVMRMPAEAVVVHVAVYRAALGGARAGDPVAAADPSRSARTASCGCGCTAGPSGGCGPAATSSTSGSAAARSASGRPRRRG